MRRRALLAASGAAFAAPLASAQHPPGADAPTERAGVDLLLVIAADASSSIDDDEAHLQRNGYRAALTDAEVLDSIASGERGAIGLAYVEWSGLEFQRLLLPWARIATLAEATSWSAALAIRPLVPAGSRRGTAISRAIDFGLHVLADAPWVAPRRVIDVSGDGVNNSGGPVEEARDRAAALGVTINGLAIEDADPGSTGGAALLGAYYRRAVIGGPGAFVVVAAGFDDFARAVRRKLVREISGRPPPRAAVRRSA